jgi:4-hydroxy-tetrahydrodipicolinate synthase
MKSHLTRQTFHGLYAILPTPFDRHGAFSAELFRQMLDVVIEYEVNGIVLAGTTGEYVSLEHAERIRMTEIAAEVLHATNIRLVVGGTAISLHEQITLGRQLAAAGAEALMNIAPLAGLLTDSEYCEFWKRLADGVGEVGLIMYHLAAISAIPGLDAVVRAARDVPAICGTKEGHNDLERWYFLHNNTDITVMPADDCQWATYYELGSRSFMTPSVGLCPALACQTHLGYLKAKWTATTPLQKQLEQLWKIITENDGLLADYGTVASYKAMCRALGWFDPGYSRLPLLDVPDDVQSALNRKIAEEFPDYCRKEEAVSADGSST